MKPYSSRPFTAALDLDVGTLVTGRAFFLIPETYPLLNFNCVILET